MSAPTQFGIGTESNQELTQKSTFDIKEETPYYEKFSNFQRWSLLILMTLNGLVGPISSNIIAPAMIPLKKSFGYGLKDPNELTAYFNLILTVYLFSLAIGPLFWGVLADAFGRRTILASLFLYTIGSICCAVSNTPQMLLGFRFVQGFGSSATTLIGVGVITDVFNREMRGRAIGIFQIGLNFGPVLGPIIGGNLVKMGWPSIFWFCSGFGAVLFFVNLFFLTETLNPNKRISIAPPIYRDQVSRTWKFNINFLANFPNPFAGFVYFRYPIVVMMAFWTMIAFGSYYVIVAFQPYVMPKFGLVPAQVGYTFIGVGMGNVCGCIVGGSLSDFFLKRRQRAEKTLKVAPEARLHANWFPAVLLIVALFLTGYFSQNTVSLPALIACQFFVGFSVLSIIACITTYIIDMLAERSGQAAGFVVFGRLFFAGITSYIAEPIRLATSYFTTYAIFGGLQFLGFVFLIVGLMYGAKMRAWNKLNV